MQIVKPNILLPGNISLILGWPGIFKGGSVERQCILLNKACVMKVGDLVRVIADGSSGLIVKIEECYLMALKTQWAILHSGEMFRFYELEVVCEKR